MVGYLHASVLILVKDQGIYNKHFFYFAYEFYHYTFLLNFIRLKKSVQCIFILHLIKVQFHCFFGMFNPKFQVFLFLFLPVFEFQYSSQDVQDNIAHI